MSLHRHILYLVSFLPRSFCLRSALKHRPRTKCRFPHPGHRIWVLCSPIHIPASSAVITAAYRCWYHAHIHSYPRSRLTLRDCFAFSFLAIHARTESRSVLAIHPFASSPVNIPVRIRALTAPAFFGPLRLALRPFISTSITWVNPDEFLHFFFSFSRSFALSIRAFCFTRSPIVPPLVLSCATRNPPVLPSRRSWSTRSEPLSAQSCWESHSRPVDPLTADSPSRPVPDAFDSPQLQRPERPSLRLFPHTPYF
ncbi:hypothetical protein B0H14DRAFT_3491864 [Mycena olivaceomarginata]|nr:hypothetical protein B0H14DRAFT_3491864 [Mycena olivaceomarginata]